MAQIHCVVVTPETTVIDEKVDFVALPLYDGEAGIGSNHSPMIGRMGHGEMRLKMSSGERSYYVDGGFVQVSDNVVSVLTNRAVPANELNRDEAQALMDKANQMEARSVELMAIRDRMMSQARGQLRMLSKP